jgi:hypothetical protein
MFLFIQIQQFEQGSVRLRVVGKLSYVRMVSDAFVIEFERV